MALHCPGAMKAVMQVVIDRARSFSSSILNAPGFLWAHDGPANSATAGKAGLIVVQDRLLD